MHQHWGQNIKILLTYSLTPMHYNPCRVLANSRSRLQPSLFLALLFQFLTPSLSASLITPSFHLRFGLPTRLLPSSLSKVIFLLAPGLYNDKTFQVPILKHRQVRLRLRHLRLILWVFVISAFIGVGRQPADQPPTWRTRVLLLAWAITFDLSGKQDPTSSKLPPA